MELWSVKQRKNVVSTVCLENSTTGDIQAGCLDTDFVYFDDLQSHCNAQCGTDALCLNDSTNPCNEVECCEKKCELTAHDNVCDDTYTEVDGLVNCKAQCSQTPPIFFECDGGCD